MIREASPSTTTNTNTPASEDGDGGLPEPLLGTMGPPPAPVGYIPPTTGGFGGWRPSMNSASDTVPRRSSEPLEAHGVANMNANPDPWNHLGGLQPRPPTEPWATYRADRGSQSDSEQTTKTRTRATRSVNSMDMTQDGTQADTNTSLTTR